MNALTRMALPVPALGTALGDAGDAYVDSLAIQIDVDGRKVLTMSGTNFEWLMTSVRLRHLSFHPRTRAFVPGELKAPSLADLIQRNWSSIDGVASEAEGLMDQANAITNAALTGEKVTWTQIN